jgi:predicted transcriptional regulator
MRLSDPCSLQQGRYAAAIERNVPAAVNRGLLAGRNSELEGLAYGVAAACHPLEDVVSEGVIPEALDYEMPQEKVRARAIAIARGQYKPKPGDPKIWFPSMKSLAETLRDKNMELIKIIAEQKPDSIAALSQKTGRASSNLSRTLNRLAIFGFVTLQKRPGNVVRPIAKAVKYNILAGAAGG